MYRNLNLWIVLLTLFFYSCDQMESNKDISKNESTISNTKLNRVEPPHWWIDFKASNLQLLVNDEAIGSSTPEIKYAGVTIEKVTKGDSPNYLFIDLKLGTKTKAGQFDIVFTFEDGSKKTHTYELKSRLKEEEEFKGFDSSDVVYLITPDRFANGDPSNDINHELKEKAIDRSNDYARHGGDIKGITDHLDYIHDMGFTAIWPNPLLINDMAQWSYHGYAITDYYRVDPRFGTLEEYINLADEARNKGIKIIMDQVANHCGLGHWWMNDLPFEDWVNYQERFENEEKTIYSNHRRTINQDIYASDQDKEGMTDGWFVDSMPDLNQRNPFMAKYIIQNSIWWIETLGLGGIRQDTYPYPDKQFMSDWAGAIMNEYPNFSIVGEEWSYNPLLIAYWQTGANNKDGYESNLESTMDFAMQSLISQAMKEEESWDKGLVKIYEGLANDFAYPNPQKIMVFNDNHDMSRIFTQMDLEIVPTKMAISYVLTIPRIPQIFYGTEILMEDSAKPGDHGLIRTDFPGGWQDDVVNAFTGDGLTPEQLDMQSFMKTILNYRKSSQAIQQGRTIHFAPKDGIYVLSRIYKEEVVVHILNKNEKAYDLDLERFKELGLEGKSLKNIITGQTFSWGDAITLEEKGVTLLTTNLN